MPFHDGKGIDPTEPSGRSAPPRSPVGTEPAERRYWSPLERSAGRVVEIDPFDLDPVNPQQAADSDPRHRETEPSVRLGIPGPDEIQRVGGRRRLRPEVVLLVVGAVFLIGALTKPWPSRVPVASPIAAASQSAPVGAGPSGSLSAEPTGEVAAVAPKASYPDIPPYDYRWPFFGSAPSPGASGGPAVPTAAPTPTWSAVDWSVLTTADAHSGWGFAAAVMPGAGPGGAIPRMSWIDAGSPPVYASVPLVRGINVYAVAVTWPSSVHVTAVKFVYLGPPRSPPYLPPAGFLPNVQVTPLPALRVASPSIRPAAAPTIPAWLNPAAGAPVSGEFLIPPTDRLHNPISSVLRSAWQESPWPWPYGSYLVTVASDSGSTHIILELLLT
jgi:hypothetical protein